MFQIQKVPGGSDDKESACNAGDPGLIFGLGKSPGEGNGYPFQSPCLGNPMDREAWRALVLGVPKSWTQLREYHFHFFTVSFETNGSSEEGQVWKKLMSLGNG